MNKKILIAIIMVVIIILIIVVTIIIKQKKQANFESSVEFTQISEDKVLFPTFSQNGEKILFFANTKEAAFYEMTRDGQNKARISDAMDTPDDIIWAPNRQLAILKVTYDQYTFEKYGSKFAAPGTPDQTMTTWLYDFENQKLSQLDNNVQNVIWMQDNKIIYQYLDREKNSNYLSMANADGLNALKIIDLPNLIEYGFNLSQDDKNLVVYSLPSDVSESSIYTLSLLDKNLKEIKKIDGSTKAIITSNRIIFSNPIKDTNAEISIMDIDGFNIKKLGIYTPKLTSVNLTDGKAAIATSEKQEGVNSILYLLDPQTNKLSKIKDLSKENIDIQYLLTSPDNKTLYFTSDDILYSLNLP